MRLLRRFRRAGCSSGGEWPLLPEGTALGCCAGDAQRGQLHFDDRRCTAILHASAS